MIAIISDVHGNLEALTAVLDRIGHARTIYCAGDIVGYGPNPNECCRLLREHDVQCVRGNHDHVCATLEEGEPAGKEARKSFQWTHEQLTEENIEWLRSLPLQLDVDGMSMVHGAPGSRRENLHAYVLDYYYSDERYEALLEQVPGKRLVLGHTHITLSHGVNSRILNPGSVGQPRDGDWRASYATIEDIRYGFRFVPSLKASFSMTPDVVHFHRAEYDIEETARKIEEETDLPSRLVKMLRHGGLHV